jgi:Caspase domain
MLPPPVRAKVLGISRKNDALVKQLADGKITFGEYNVKRIEILKQTAVAFGDIWEVRPRETAQSAGTAPDPKPLPSQKRSIEQQTPQTFAPHEVRIALVIGESRYLNLPRLINPEKDARSIAETLQKMGYNTHLLLDASEDGIRKEIRKFASESSKADVAVVFYAGHGAQLNGSNYLLPLDIDVPHTEADIQFATRLSFGASRTSGW